MQIDCGYGFAFLEITVTIDEDPPSGSTRVQVAITDPDGNSASTTGYLYYALQRKTFEYPADFFGTEALPGTYQIDVRADFERVAGGSFTIR